MGIGDPADLAEWLAEDLQRAALELRSGVGRARGHGAAVLAKRVELAFDAFAAQGSEGRKLFAVEYVLRLCLMSAQDMRHKNFTFDDAVAVACDSSSMFMGEALSDRQCRAVRDLMEALVFNRPHTKPRVTVATARLKLARAFGVNVKKEGAVERLLRRRRERIRRAAGRDKR